MIYHTKIYACITILANSSYFSSHIRFIEINNQNPIKTRLQPPSTRIKKRQAQARDPTSIGDKDLFLSGPTKGGRSVLSAIDDFDQKASVPQKTSANFAVLKGYHVSDCSDSYGTFSSALVKTLDVDRKMATAEIRPENLNYHNMYNGNSISTFHQPNIIILVISLIVSIILSQK